MQHKDEIDFTMNLNDLHDVISRIFNIIDNDMANKEIKENKDLIGLNGKTLNIEGEKITFKMASNTNDLILTGIDMHICVGSYCSYALDETSYICIGYNKEGKPRVCVEINKDGVSYKVKQFKLRFNKQVDAETSYKVESMFNDLNIKSLCRDLTLNRVTYETCGDAILA